MNVDLRSYSGAKKKNAKKMGSDINWRPVRGRLGQMFTVRRQWIERRGGGERAQCRNGASVRVRFVRPGPRKVRGNCGEGGRGVAAVYI